MWVSRNKQIEDVVMSAASVGGADRLEEAWRERAAIATLSKEAPTSIASPDFVGARAAGSGQAGTEALTQGTVEARI